MNSLFIVQIIVHVAFWVSVKNLIFGRPNKESRANYDAFLKNEMNVKGACQ